jgi:hypothetical protein
MDELSRFAQEIAENHKTLPFLGRLICKSAFSILTCIRTFTGQVMSALTVMRLKGSAFP